MDRYSRSLAHSLRKKLFHLRVNFAVLSLVSMNVSHIVSGLEGDTKKKKRTPQAQTVLQLEVFVSLRQGVNV